MELANRNESLLVQKRTRAPKLSDQDIMWAIEKKSEKNTHGSVADALGVTPKTLRTSINKYLENK